MPTYHVRLRGTVQVGESPLSDDDAIRRAAVFHSDRTVDAESPPDAARHTFAEMTDPQAAVMEDWVSLDDYSWVFDSSGELIGEGLTEDLYREVADGSAR